MYAAAARRQAAAAPVPQSSSSALNVLKLEDDEKKVPTSQTSSATPGMPSSWQGFDIKTDPEMRKMAAPGQHWADFTSSPFVSNSPFEGISGTAPAFPEDNMVSATAEENVDATEKKEEEKEKETAAVVPSPATPTQDAEDKEEKIEAPAKEVDQTTENSDGAEPFEQEQPAAAAVPQYAEFGPAYNQHPYHQYYHMQQPQYQPPQQHMYPPSYAQAPYQTPQVQQQRTSGFQNHRTRQQQQQQPMSRNYSSPAAQNHVEKKDSGASSAMPLSQPANHELLGHLPFFKYSDMALQTELPTAEAIGAEDRSHPKLFIGHIWSKVPTGAVQWLLDSFAPSGATAFAPQLHFNKEGWFRGCLHVSVAAQDPSSMQSLIFSLHKRVLFDHEGVWFAQNEDQQRMLDDYCRRLRQLPQHVRHQKLQSLPCNPLACELARNE